jgi:hypothetical protein
MKLNQGREREGVGDTKSPTKDIAAALNEIAILAGGYFQKFPLQFFSLPRK